MHFRLERHERYTCPSSFITDPRMLANLHVDPLLVFADREAAKVHSEETFAERLQHRRTTIMSIVATGDISSTCTEQLMNDLPISTASTFPTLLHSPDVTPGGLEISQVTHIRCGTAWRSLALLQD